MDPKFIDVNQTLSFGKEKQAWKLAAFSGFGLAIGIFCIYTGDRDLMLPGWVCIAVCGPITAFYLYRTLDPGTPFLILSPDGIFIFIEFVKQVKIPWNEVHGVDQIDIESNFRGDKIVHPNVTVFLVTRRFYDRFIHVDNWLLQGPNWNAYYVPKGDMMQVALHDSILPATSDELRAAVESRWKAFGGKR